MSRQEQYHPGWEKVKQCKITQSMEETLLKILAQPCFSIFFAFTICPEIFCLTAVPLGPTGLVFNIIAFYQNEEHRIHTAVL